MASKLGLYIHIPFCERKCNYCGFLSFTYKGNEKMYFENLQREIKNKGSIFKEKYVVDSIFIGGGTPSFVDKIYIEKTLTTVYEAFKIHENCEITIETNPSSITEEKIMSYKNMGINRFSLGVQSFNNSELEALGRIHTREEAIEKIKMFKALGVENLNVDLIFDIPSQSIHSWRETLKMAVELEADHISAYSLQIEEGTKFYEDYKKEVFSTAGDEDLYKFYRTTWDILNSYGYENYEISNYSKNSKTCKHNLKYWKNLEYLGLGLGSSSYVLGKRWENPSDFHKYFQYTQFNKTKIKKFIENLEKIDRREAMGIFVFTALRLKDGLDIGEFEKVFNTSFYNVYEKEIKNLKNEIDKGNCVLDLKKGRFFITEKGILKSNEIMCEFV